MRLMLKRISVFVMALLIAFTSLGGGFKTYAAEKSDVAIETVVDTYMEAREKLLKNDNVKKLEKVAVAGIIEDEELHRDLLQELGIKVKNIECEIEEVNDSDTFVEVTVVETFAYAKNGEKSECETTHMLTLMKDSSDAWWVVSDSYFEEATEFISCSYVPADGGISTFVAVSLYTPTIVTVADTQVWY